MKQIGWLLAEIIAIGCLFVLSLAPGSGRDTYLAALLVVTALPRAVSNGIELAQTRPAKDAGGKL